MAKKKKQAPDGPVRARDTEVNYYTVCGLMFLLGMIVFFFMIYLCFRARQPGSSQMLILLDCVEAVLLIYLLLSVSFIRIATGKRGAAKIKYSEKPMKRSSQGAALLKKEALRFWSSPTYMMNCSLGSIIASLSFSGFVGVQDTDELLEYLPALQEASRKISQSLYRCWNW